MIKKNFNENNSQLGSYLAGLIEGKGDIWTTKELKNLKGKICNPRISFTFHKNELPLFMYLKELFGAGSIYPSKYDSYSKYSIADSELLIEIINLINDKFRTPKLLLLHNAIDRVNLLHGTDIKKLPLDSSDLNSSAWLAVITDAQGNFYVYLKDNKELNTSSNEVVGCRFAMNKTIANKWTTSTSIPFMTEIANFLACRVYNKMDDTLVCISNVNNKYYLIKSYFEKYPLMSSKYLDYLSYLEALNYLGKDLTDEEIKEIHYIIDSMNKQRTYYSWYHLSNFYKKYL
jgi:hypothetical protein